MLSSSLRMCEECMKCLRYDMECEGSFERHVFLSAKQLLQNIIGFQQMLGRCWWSIAIQWWFEIVTFCWNWFKNTKKFELKKIKGVKTLKIRIMSQWPTARAAKTTLRTRRPEKPPPECNCRYKRQPFLGWVTVWIFVLCLHLQVILNHTRIYMFQSREGSQCTKLK